MRKLLIIGICLLIVTLAVGADARDRNSRDSTNSSASSRDSSSSSDRQSGVSKDRQNSSSSDTSNRRSSASSSKNNRTTSSGYRPSGTATRSEVGPSSSSSSGSNRSVYSGSRDTATRSEVKPPSSDSNRQISPAYRPGSGSVSSGNSDTGRVSSRSTRSVDPVYPAYRPVTRQNADSPSNTRTIPTPTADTRGTRDIYSAHRPNTSSRSIVPVPTVNHGTQSGRTLYNPNKNADTSNSIGRPSTDSRVQTRDKTGSDATSYRPAQGGNSSNRSNTPLGNQTRSQDRSGYKPNTGSHQATTKQLPTTRSIRDRKLADARTSSFGSYRPSTDRSFTYANYSRPKGYRPPNYRSGQYYYSTPRYTRPCSFGFWSFDYYQGFSRRSLYFHYGLFPYIAITRIILDSYPTVVYVDQPIYSISRINYEGNRYPGLDDSLADIRSAWVSGRYDLIQEHVRDSYDIAVLLDGKYDYSVTADDYLAMTQDALGGMDTVSFSWNKVQSRQDGTVTAFATHTYRSGDSTRRVYVSFTLQRVGSRYYIVEVGSTQEAWN